MSSPTAAEMRYGAYMLRFGPHGYRELAQPREATSSMSPSFRKLAAVSRPSLNFTLP